MIRQTQEIRKRVILPSTLAIMMAATGWFLPQAFADPLSVGDGAVFRLNSESTFEQGCYDPCLCPIMTRAGVRGTLKLIHTGFDGVLHTYAVEDVNWTVPAGDDPLAATRIIGSGTYQIGSPDPITLLQHRMVLDLKVGAEPVQHFDSGWLPVADSSKIKIAVSMNGMYCFDTVIRIDASMVPNQEIQPYVLTSDSTFQRGCFDPCDCLLEQERPMIGTFRLVPLISTLPITEFAVVGVRWHVPYNSVGETIPISGFGVYQLLGDFTLQHRLALDLIAGNEERAHFDSGIGSGAELFPRIDAVVSEHGLVCLDTVLHVVADPVAIQACGGGTGQTCPAGEFCKLPVGQCGNNAVGMCTQIPPGCPDVWDPVCGCDGVTYGNDCDADADAVSVAHHGACEPICRPASSGFGCVPIACSTIPEEQCIPTNLHIDWSSGAITTVSCECLDFNFCHIEFGDASPFAIGHCPDGGTCTVVGADTDGDGLDDQFHAECLGAGACCSDVGGSPLPVPVCTEAPQDSCEAGGVFLGVGTTCDPVEACCLTFGGGPASCIDLNPQCCSVFSGVARGPGSTCSAAACGQVCGGIAGIPCSSSASFCKLPAGACNSADLPGICTTIPNGCPAVWEPVCGCDGTTYGNHCEADKAGVSINYPGECAGTPCAATRYFSNVSGSYCPQVPQTVRIVFTPPAGTIVVAVEDAPPDGWGVGNISDNGTYDAANGKVKWGPFFAPAIPGAVTYNVVPTNDTTVAACFDGTVSLDGVNKQICGDSCIELSCPTFMAADMPQPACPACPIGDCTSCPDGTCRDGRTTMCEMLGYACAWKVGCNDDIASMARAAFVWRNGECYCWDTAQDNWFSTPCPPPDSGLCIDAAGGGAPALNMDDGVAVIDTTNASTRKETRKPNYNVNVVVEAPQGASAMALEINVPKGWKVTTISDSGEWDGNRRKIKWGPFFDVLSRTLSFTALPPETFPMQPFERVTRIGRPAKFSGTVSFDGMNQPVIAR